MMKQIFYFFTIAILTACYSNTSNMKMLEKEILETEKTFAQMADTIGIAEAFIFYAADDAVLLRNNQLIKGKTAIQQYFTENSHTYETIKLKWLPDKIEVAESGDLAYTYGSYQVIDTKTNNTTSTGVFHTVWKRQSNGQWRFVWD